MGLAQPPIDDDFSRPFLRELHHTSPCSGQAMCRSISKVIGRKPTPHGQSAANAVPCLEIFWSRQEGHDSKWRGCGGFGISDVYNLICFLLLLLLALKKDTLAVYRPHDALHGSNSSFFLKRSHAWRQRRDFGHCMVLGCVDDLGHDSTSHVGTDLVGRGDVPRLRKRVLFAPNRLGWLIPVASRPVMIPFYLGESCSYPTVSWFHKMRRRFLLHGGSYNPLRRRVFVAFRSQLCLPLTQKSTKKNCWFGSDGFSGSQS